MPKKEGSKADMCRAFLQKNPLGTFKDFDKETPGVLTSAYFATMKSILKKKGEVSAEAAPAGENAPKKRGRPPKSASKAPKGTVAAPKASNGRGRPKAAATGLQAKIDDQRQFLAWVELGMAKGYVTKLKDHLQ